MSKPLKPITTQNGLSHNDDALNLSINTTCQKMLCKTGSSFPEPERVIYSEKLIKINRKGKEQDRALLITDKAIYNLMPSDFSKCKRRIDLDLIESITISTVSEEFVIHIPDEYDYRFKSINKERLSAVLYDCFCDRNVSELTINRVSQSSLLSVTVTKDAVRLQTREERFKRYKELLQSFQTTLNDSDEEDVNEIKKAKPYKNINALQKARPEDFEFLKVIGRGSFGKVMQVRKRDDGSILAMKILKKKAIIARNQVEHTKSERLILGQLQELQHPFLMRLQYAFQTNEKLYFVLDYYLGGELFFHLKKKRRFTESEAQIMVAQVTLAIGHLHSINVIYRDLKPENILLDKHGNICLTDFGLSKQERNKNNLSHTFCGTPEYLAPEIVTNIGHSKAVDWWSLGVLLYELTIGIPPFYSQNVNEMYKKIQGAPLQFPPQTTRRCKALIALLLERNVRYRLGSGPDDVEEIKRHPFFRNIDWDLLLQKKIEPIYKPNVKNEYDVSNFDKQFTNEPVIVTYESKTGDVVANDENSNNNNKMHPQYKGNNYNGNNIRNLHKDRSRDKDSDDMFEEFSFVAIPEDDED